MNDLVSIIIPVFNAEKYLSECIESVLAQTYKNFEAIIVDDGSTDKSAEIIDFYSNKEKKIHSYHKKNGGVSSARNYGIEKALGKYICFIDSDDTIENYYIESLYQALQGKADSSVGGFKHFNIPEKKEIIVVPQKNEIKNLNDSILDFLDYEKTDWQRYMVNRIFKTSIIKNNNIRFREDIFYKEDGLFLIDYLCSSNGLVGYVNRIVYLYRYNSNSALGSLTKSFNTKLLTNIDAYLLIIDRLKKSDLPKSTIEKAKTNGFISCSWISDIMNNTNSNSLYLRSKLEFKTFSILGIKRYLKWKCAMLSAFFNHKDLI